MELLSFRARPFDVVQMQWPGQSGLTYVCASQHSSQTGPKETQPPGNKRWVCPSFASSCGAGKVGARDTNQGGTAEMKEPVTSPKGVRAGIGWGSRPGGTSPGGAAEWLLPLGRLPHQQHGLGARVLPEDHGVHVAACFLGSLSEV